MKTYRRRRSDDAWTITRSARSILETCGWFVVDFQHNEKMPSGAVGWPDLVAIRRGVVWLIEIKAPGDRIRPSQADFFRRLRDHLGATLRYMIAESADDIARIVTGDAGAIEIPEKFLSISPPDWRGEVENEREQDQ